MNIRDGPRERGDFREVVGKAINPDEVLRLGLRHQRFDEGFVLRQGMVPGGAAAAHASIHHHQDGPGRQRVIGEEGVPAFQAFTVLGGGYARRLRPGGEAVFEFEFAAVFIAAGQGEIGGKKSRSGDYGKKSRQHYGKPGGNAVPEQQERHQSLL